MLWERMEGRFDSVHRVEKWFEGSDEVCFGVSYHGVTVNSCQETHCRIDPIYCSCMAE
jgi:hypothetical protein